MNSELKSSSPMDESSAALAQMEERIRHLQRSQIDMMQSQLSIRKENECLNAQLAQANQSYNLGLMMFMFHPAKKGASHDSILKTLGFYAACCLFSKSFRCDVKDAVTDMFCGDVERYASVDDSVWRKRKVRVERDDSDGHLTLTPDSIAMMKIALCKQAYEDMREPDSNISAILMSYHDDEESLYKIAAKNGISRNVLDVYSRRMVHNMLMENPDDKKYFSELAYGDAVLQPTGSCNYKNGDSFNCFFTPRQPENYHDLNKRMSMVWDSLFETAASPVDVERVAFSSAACDMQYDFEHYNTDDKFRIGVVEDTSVTDDFHGANPFVLDGCSQNVNDFLSVGPKSCDTNYITCNCRPLLSAVGRWVNRHIDFSPAYYQGCANDLFLDVDADNREAIRKNVTDLFVKRDSVAKFWHRFLTQHTFVELCPVTDLTVTPKQAETVSKKRDDLSISRLNALSDMFQAQRDNVTLPPEYDGMDF